MHSPSSVLALIPFENQSQVIEFTFMTSGPQSSFHMGQRMTRVGADLRCCKSRCALACFYQMNHHSSALVEFAKICPSVGNIPAAECQFRLLAPMLEPRASQLELQLCIWWGLGQFNVTKALAVADNRV
jgi:hypothetical protein